MNRTPLTLTSHPSRLLRSKSAQALALLLAACVAPAPLAAQPTYQEPSKVNIAWNRLYNYDEVVSISRELVAAYPDLLTLESIGKSVQGRDIWVITLNAKPTGPAESKPAIYIDANIHGNEVQGSEVVLYSIWYLTKSYGRVAQLTQLIDRSAFYFIPMVNPDGRAYWFDQPNSMNSSRGGQKPTDNDGDGLFDEDPPNDLDGDGLLLQMRREDPNGRWRESADDPRMLVQIAPDAKGEFKRYSRVNQEGIDDDGDGDVNEDGAGGYDPNRNWPADWQPEYIQFGAGDYPLSLPESKAIADFILARPNIAAVQAYHNSGGMILRPPGAKYIEYAQEDVSVYDRIGQRGERILPFYRYMIIWKDLYTVYGGFVNWTAEDLGIISFTNELWSDDQYYQRKEPDTTEKERLDFNDYVLFGQAFVPWKPLTHPVYGAVEVGGWIKMTGRIPPSFNLEELCHRNFAFTMFHAEQMPLVEIDNATLDDLGDGLTRVRVDVHNRRLIPTTTAQGAKRGVGPRDYIELIGEGVHVVAGGRVRDRFLAPFEFVESRPQRLWLDRGLAGESTTTFQWLVSGAGPAKVRFGGPRVADVERSLTVAPQK